MDILSMLSLGGSYGIMMSGVNLWNGWRNRIQQQNLQEQRERFQEAMQRRQFEETERLQRTITRLQYENALNLQRTNQQIDWENHLNRVYLADVWPLVCPPLHYLDLLARRAGDGKLPMQIILSSQPAGCSAVYDDLRLLFNRPIYRDKVFYYDGGWKNGFGEESARVLPLQERLSGCPTMILAPKDDQSSGWISLSVTYWGICERGGHYTTMEVFKMRRVSFYAELAKMLADDYTLTYRDISDIPESIKKLIDTRECEKKERARLERENTSASDIQDRLADLYDYRYEMCCRDRLINDKLAEKYQSVMFSLMGLVATTMVDIERLIDYHESPIGLNMMGGYKALPRERMMDVVANCFLQNLPTLGDDYALPLYYAEVASAFNQLPDGREIAEKIALAGWEAFNAMYSNASASVVMSEAHRSAYRQLALIRPASGNICIDAGTVTSPRSRIYIPNSIR